MASDAERDFLRGHEPYAEITGDMLNGFSAMSPINTAVYRVEADGSFCTLFLSENIPDLLKMRREEYLKITEHDAMDLTLPEDRTGLREATLQCLRTGNPMDYYYRVFHNTKGFEWVHVNAHICGRMAGHALIIANFSNMTEEGWIYQELLDESDREIIVLDRNTYELLYANKKAKESENRKENLLHQTCHSFLFGSTKPCEDCFLADLTKTDVGIKEHQDAASGKWMRYVAIQATWCRHDAVILFIKDITREKEVTAKTEQYKQMYDDAAKVSKLVIWEYNPDEHKVYMMQSGYTRDICLSCGFPEVIENMPETLACFVDEQDKERYLNVYRKIDNGAEESTGEFRFKLPSQDTQQYERITLRRINDENGKMITVHCCGENITAQKRAQIEYDKFHEQIAEHITGVLGSFQLNLSKNRYISGYSPYPRIIQMLKCETADEHFILTADTLLDKKLRQKFKEIFTCANLQEQFWAGQKQISLDYSVASVSGSTLWVHGTIYMMQNPETGDIEGLTYCTDITKQKRNAEIADRIASEDSEYIGIINIQNATMELYKEQPNVSYEIHAGTIMPYADICRFMTEKYLAEKDRQSYLDEVKLSSLLEKLEQFGNYSLTYNFTDPNSGQTRKKQLRYSWLNDEKTDILSFQQDITETFMKEQEQVAKIHEALLEANRANESKRVFLSSMSHDLRTPLNGVIGFSDLAIGEDDPEKKQYYLKKIKSSGELLLGLVNDTLELSRIESGKYTLEIEAVDSRMLGENVATSLLPAAEMKGVHLIARHSDFPEETVYTDKLKVQKIFLNLISNAIKFTPAGGTVRVSVEKIDPPENGCNRRFIVEDNGVGIDPDFVPDLYEPFSQDSRNTNSKVMGTGLGLSIVKKIVDLMGGNIHVKSEVNKGTCFTVNVPLRTESLQTATDAAAASYSSLKGKTVLLCEDNDMNAEIAGILLRGQGLTVEHAVNGRDGLKIFAESPEDHFDAILMDIRMPVMNGYEATKAIRALAKADSKSVPIIAMTADAFEEDIREANAVGMNDYVTKPIEPQRLYDVLQKNIAYEKSSN
jgi:signal transduction histidine kinase/CheY-like chemotaxis protein/PAS domain-containing protein